MSSEHAQASTGPAALFVSSRWTTTVDRLSLINASLAASLAKEEIPTYCTTLEVKAESFSVDKDTGVTLVSALEDKVRLLSNKDPSSDWLIGSHRSLYPDMYTIPGVDIVVGHMALGDDNGLINAALTMKDDIGGPGANLFLFNHGIPEDIGDNDLEALALDAAKEAKVVWSIGPYVYDHFESKYKALHPHPTHYCYYPALNEQFTKMMVQPFHIGKQQILTMCDVKSEKDFERYYEIAVAIGKVAESFKGLHEIIPGWKLYGVNDDVNQKFRQYLENNSKCGHLRISIVGGVELQELLIAVKQSVLLVAPEKKDPFNFPAFLAMQVGLPVLIPGFSGLARALKALFPSDDYDSFFSVDTGLHDFTVDVDSNTWKDKITERLQRNGIAFKKSGQLKDALMEHEQFKESLAEFIWEAKVVLDCGYEATTEMLLQPETNASNRTPTQVRTSSEPFVKQAIVVSTQRRSSASPTVGVPYRRNRSSVSESDGSTESSAAILDGRRPSSVPSSHSMGSLASVCESMETEDSEPSTPMDTDQIPMIYSKDEQFERDTKEALELSRKESQSDFELPQYPHSIVWCERLRELIDLNEKFISIGNIKICETDEKFKIATGCEGTKVYLGIDVYTGQEVAVKRVNKGDKTDAFIIEEEKVVKSLSGDNIVRYSHVIHTDQYVYIIMELCEKTLGNYIQELKSDKDKLQEISKQLVIDVLKGLRTLHHNNPKILHRDLKPANVLIDIKGTAKLTDFGISRCINPDQSTCLTGASGTLMWQPREVLLGPSNQNGSDSDSDNDSDDDMEEERDNSMEESGIATSEKKTVIEYSSRSDIQVAGMLMAFILSGGYHPFGSLKYTMALSQCICKGTIHNKNINKIPNHSARHLVRQMLLEERHDRPSIGEVLRHPYFWEETSCCRFLQAVCKEINLNFSHHFVVSRDSSNAVAKQLQGEAEKIDCKDLVMTMNNPESDVLTRYPELIPSIYDVILQSNKRGDDNWTLRENIKPFFTDDVI
ncbi:uncharacterized protein LOC144448191 [Glandiceps talaboti]